MLEEVLVIEVLGRVLEIAYVGWLDKMERLGNWGEVPN